MRFTPGTGSEADCITDNLTGLIWLKDPGTTKRTWSKALDYVRSISSCGTSDWRLPNILELESLINLNMAGSAPWLTRPENGFIGIAANQYWSSTTKASATEQAWVVDFNDDGRSFVAKDSAHLALSVRGTTSLPSQLWKTGQTSSYGTRDDGELQAGVAWPSPRFADPVNGTVKDNLTGLIWALNANTPGPSTCNPGVAKSSYDAYLYIQCLNNTNYLSYSDWRLPNRKELESLIDHSRSNPALPLGHPFLIADPKIFWTSDTYIPLCSSAWAVNLNTGEAIDLDKVQNNMSVWPVRGPLSLKVLIAGEGTGSIDNNKVSCYGKSCLGVFSSGDPVTIVADASVDSVFGGWTGCPNPSDNECTIIMSEDITVTGSFLAARSIWKKSGSLNLGKVGVSIQSSQKYIAVKNIYTSDLHVQSVSKTGTNAAEFILDEDCSGVILSPGETCSIAVSINALAYGTRQAEMIVTFDNPKVPFVRITLRAKALPAKIYVKPKSLNFGKVSTSGSSQQQIAIQNKGLTPLTILSMERTGDHAGDFTINSTDCTVLQEGQDCSVTVQFTPGANGKRTGGLVISSDAPKKDSVTIKLKGDGI